MLKDRLQEFRSQASGAVEKTRHKTELAKTGAVTHANKARRGITSTVIEIGLGIVGCEPELRVSRRTPTMRSVASRPSRRTLRGAEAIKAITEGAEKEEAGLRTQKAIFSLVSTRGPGRKRRFLGMKPIPPKRK